MQTDVKAAFAHEMAEARRRYAADDLDGAFRSLERAHILGQRFLVHHLVSHWWMFRVGLRRADAREIAGQMLRMAAALPGHALGWVPVGNTGGADVSPIRPMPVPADLAVHFRGYSLARTMAGRLLLWTAAAGLAFVLAR